MVKLQATVQTTQTTEVKIAPRIKRKLLIALKAYADMKVQRDLLDFKMDKFKEEVGDIREAIGEEKLEVEGFKIAHVQGTMKKLNHQKLIALGCAAQWITDATEEKPKKGYEKITCPGDPNEGREYAD